PPLPSLGGKGVQPACVACVCKTRRRRAIDFSPRSNQSEWQFGKVLGGKSQMIVTSHVAFIEYFANRLSSLAKWQRTRHPYENADDGRHKGDILNCWIRLSRALRHVR